MNARCCATPLYLAEAQAAEPGCGADMRNSRRGKRIYITESAAADAIITSAAALFLSLSLVFCKMENKTSPCIFVTFCHENTGFANRFS